MTNHHAQVSALDTHRDARGILSVLEASGLPFRFQRMFTVTAVPAGTSRGGHAHRQCHQFLIATTGTVTVTFDSGGESKSVVLDGPTKGLHLPPMTWASECYSGPDAVLLVLASEPYDKSKCVDDRSVFDQLIGSEPG